MPQYFCTDHALQRLRQRFPTLAPLFPIQDGTAIVNSRRRISFLAHHARPMGQQRGNDLLLKLSNDELLPGSGVGPVVFVVSPHREGNKADQWAIRTIFTMDMAVKSSCEAQKLVSENGKRRRRDRRCCEYIRRLRKQSDRHKSGVAYHPPAIIASRAA
ncbi:MAG: hypothetical protein EA401_13820 [Planctomycetota bacterium]|nr:MAG: hypothetical protein EA401_13820 [Planctomycetota bacterium]